MVEVTKEIEEKIEEIRKKMYEAYESAEKNEQVLKLSQQLDMMLNKFDKLKKN